MPIFDLQSGLKEKISTELIRMNQPEIVAAAARTKITAERYNIWEKPPNHKEKLKEDMAC